MSEDKLKKEIELIFESSPNIQIIDWLPDDVDGPLFRQVAWYHMARYSSTPESIISSNGDISAWLQSCLLKMNIQSECLLSLGGVGNLPWLKVRVKNDWLKELWSQREFVVLYNDKVFGFMDDEYHHEFHQFEAKFINDQKPSYLKMREENRKKLALLKEKNLQS